MDLTAFVRELLFGHDCVIVPGFGGFIGNYTPAHIDKNAGTFYPPVKQISFNRNLNHNDGLLIGRISGSAGITYGDARNMVEEFVIETRRKLDKGDKVVFDKIGSFTHNQEGNIQFEPEKGVNYHLDSYGLESFQCLPLAGYDVRKRILKHHATDKTRHFPFRKILWRAAVVIPLLSVLIAVPIKTDLFKSKVETTTLNPLVLAEFEHNKLAVDEESTLSIEEIIAPPAEKSEVPAITQPESSETAPVKVVHSEVKTSEITAPVYFLITGSFKTEKNAYRQIKMLETEGFTPEVVEAANGFYRVSAMMCPDLNTALTRKDIISKKFPGTWISRKR